MVTVKPKRSRKTRNFYAQALTQAERLAIPEAQEVDVAQEIAALRVRLRSALEDPADMALILRGLDVLRRLLATRYGLSKADQREMGPYAEETLRRIQGRGEGGRGGHAEPE